MKIYRIAERFSGEWWIIDGSASFADGDIGDMNHEAYVISYARHSLADSDEEGEFLSWQEREATEIAESLAEQELFDVDKERILEECKSDPVGFLINHLDNSNIDQELFFVANGNHSDPRRYAIEKLGWKRLMGNTVETWHLTVSDLKNIGSGLWDAYGDQMEDEAEAGDEPEFNIEVVSAKKVYWNVPFDVISRGDISGLRGHGMDNRVFSKPANSYTKMYRVSQLFGNQDPDTRNPKGREIANKWVFDNLGGVNIGDVLNPADGSNMANSIDQTYVVTKINPDFSVNLSSKETGRVMPDVALYGFNKRQRIVPRWKKGTIQQ